MKVEMNWNGEDLDITLTKQEALDLASFLEFFGRERLYEDTVQPEEYGVAEKLHNEIDSYIDEY